MHALAGHLCELGLPAVRASVADPGSLAFAARFGFAETDQQIEQVRRIAAEPAGVLPWRLVWRRRPASRCPAASSRAMMCAWWPHDLE